MFLDHAPPKSDDARQWHQVFSDNWLHSYDPDQLDGLFKKTAHRNRAPPYEIALILLGFRARTSGFDGTTIVSYAASLLRTKIVAMADLLSALLKRSRFLKVPGKPQPAAHRTTATTLEEMLFTLMFQSYLSGNNSELSFKVLDASRLLPMLTRWLRVVTDHEMAQQLEHSTLHVVDPCTFGMYEALASLALSILGSPIIRLVMKEPWWKERRSSVVTDMENFDNHVLQWIHSRFTNSLSALTKIPPFVDVDRDGKPIFTEQQVMQSITDLPVAHSRAGLYIWVNACLCGRPFTEDMSMLAYLQARYPDDNQSLAVDLQIASFDVLTNSLLRKESQQSVRLIRSFICNKIPLLLCILAGYMAPMALETCVQMAFMSITVDALPPISAGANEIREVIKRTRLEYLQACALQGVIAEASVGLILHEQGVTLPKVIKYSKDGLVAQCNNNLGRLDTLADELQNMHGNAGAIVACLVQMIRTFCVNKDNMSLKAACNTLMKRPSEIDIVVLFAQPSSILGPLCLLLDGWVQDQDQTEFTPAYEEFASILLFILVFMHRYGLDKADLGLSSDTDGFVSQLQRNFSSSLPLSQLTPEQSTQLSKWGEGLFSIDEHGETSGISDEVMRHCPPQAFYLLVPTLFDQSVLACKVNALTISTFKSGLELLLEPFLLPSLVGGLTWLAKHSWDCHGDVNILLQMLDKLLKPSSGAQETLAMHKAVLGIVADPLIRFLQDVLRKRSAKKDINALIELLKPYSGQRRIHYASLKEVREWTVGHSEGLASCLRGAIHDMITWTSSIGHSPPTRYTHLLYTATYQILGADEVLKAVVAEVKEQTAVNNGSVALDICAAMICAPSPSAPGLIQTTLPDTSTADPGTSLSVRDTLKLTVSDTTVFISRPVSDAEALVRLHRRVEAQLAMQQVPLLPMTTAIQEEATNQIIKDLGLDDGTNGTALVEQSANADFASNDLNVDMEQPINLEVAPRNIDDLTVDHNGMDIDFIDLGMNMNQHSGANADNVQQNAEDDIFAGLDMNRKVKTSPISTDENCDPSDYLFEHSHGPSNLTGMSEANGLDNRWTISQQQSARTKVKVRISNSTSGYQFSQSSNVMDFNGSRRSGRNRKRVKTYTEEQAEESKLALFKSPPTTKRRRRNRNQNAEAAAVSSFATKTFAQYRVTKPFNTRRKTAKIVIDESEARPLETTQSGKQATPKTAHIINDWHASAAENRIAREHGRIKRVGNGAVESRLRPERSAELDCHAHHTDCPLEKIQLAGSTGNVYTVTVSHLLSCTCPVGLFQARASRSCCKHVIYVLHNVLKIPDNLKHQNALLTSELRDVFQGSPALTNEAMQSEPMDGNRKDLGDDCPICFMHFDPGEEITWCRAGCGNNIHQDCFERWERTKPGKITCPFCRVLWQKQTTVKSETARVADITVPDERKAGGYRNVRHLLEYNE
nr:mediator of rna polymerase ii transcription subunit 5 [Quercus suber]